MFQWPDRAMAAYFERLMTSDQKLDQLERLARLLCERPLHRSRESSIPSASLGDYVTALGEYEAASQALEQKPDDSQRTETLNRARESLVQARDKLKRLNKNRSGCFPVG